MTILKSDPLFFTKYTNLIGDKPDQCRNQGWIMNWLTPCRSSSMISRYRRSFTEVMDPLWFVVYKSVSCLHRPLLIVIMDSEHFTEWSTYSTALYSTQRPPPLGTVDTSEKLEKMAREHLIKVASEGTSTLMSNHTQQLSSGAFLYVFGSAGVWKTYEANRKALDKWAIIPRMLRNCTSRSLEV